MLGRKVTNYGNVAGVCFVCKYFAENVLELETGTPSESLPTRQNGDENRDN